MSRSRTRVLVLAGAAAVLGLGIWLVKSRMPRKPEQEPVARQSEVVIDNSQIADAGLVLASQFTGVIADTNSLADLRTALEARGRGLTVLTAELARQESRQAAPTMEMARLHYQIATLLLYEGRFEEASASLNAALKIGPVVAMPADVRANLTALLGVSSLRQGEVENCIQCVGPSSCIFPISPAAVHTQPNGSRQAIKHFTEYLELVPGDLRVRWNLNLAYMTLGEYPDKVPPKYLIPLDTFGSAADVGRFQNVATSAGLTARGPNQAGGSVFDDFTGDGLPDLFVTSLDTDRGAALFVNRGDGTFEDRSKQAGLDDQIYALNVSRADFDNDGQLDVLLLRGGWENPMRMSLLRNLGNGTFEDVTIASGLAEPIASEAGVWGDYDNDGLVDLFVSGEFRPPFAAGPNFRPDPRNRCRLYHNEGNGKFVNVAQTVGVAAELCSKGAAWGDFDADGRLDLYVSNMSGPGRLFRNESNDKFRDVTTEMGVAGPDHGFACWFWDYDNDGRLDLSVIDYTSSLAEFVAISLGKPVQRSSRPRMYRNAGPDGFREVTREVGLDRLLMPMGCNFADIDNDGFLDLYLGTGRMALEVLVPNLMLKNQAGTRFDDVTISSGTGHLQKGHGISFADWDCDGDLDLFVEAGGAVPGDRAYNVLFQNPGHGRHWLKIKLVGDKSNRAALGARIKAVVLGADGKPRTIHRTVGNNGSFGGNSLVESIGLLDDTRVAELEVFWPTSQTTQTFRDIAADQAIEITEGVAVLKPLPQPWVGGQSK
ncbi:MAG: FG-GAP-like repeat-containing protein [Planctomycetaceae bacterium]